MIQHANRRTHHPRALTKDQILKNYLPVFFNALVNKVKYIIYLDPFAGPGRYDDETEGSPIHALNTVAGLNEKIKKNFKDKCIFILVDHEKETYEKLKNSVKKYKSEGFKVFCIHAIAQEVINIITEEIQKNLSLLKLLFLFI